MKAPPVVLRCLPSFFFCLALFLTGSGSAQEPAPSCLQRAMEAASSQWLEDTDEAALIAATLRVGRVGTALRIFTIPGTDPIFIDLVAPTTGEKCELQASYRLVGTFNAFALIRFTQGDHTQHLFIEMETGNTHLVDAVDPLISQDGRLILFNKVDGNTQQPAFALYDTLHFLRVVRLEGRRIDEDGASWQEPRLLKVTLVEDPAKKRGSAWSRLSVDDLGISSSSRTPHPFLPVELSPTRAP